MIVGHEWSLFPFSRMLAFKVGGTASLLPASPPQLVLNSPAFGSIDARPPKHQSFGDETLISDNVFGTATRTLDFTRASRGSRRRRKTSCPRKKWKAGPDTLPAGAER